MPPFIEERVKKDKGEMKGKMASTLTSTTTMGPPEEGPDSGPGPGPGPGQGHPVFEGVDHKGDIGTDLCSLLTREDLSDVTLLVEGKLFKGHKVILALRSDYFAALLFGGLKESQEKEVTLRDTKCSSFGLIFEYLYTGFVPSDKLNIENMFHLLEDAHRLGFVKLERALVRSLRSGLSTQVALRAYETGVYFGFKELEEDSLQFMDRNAALILKHHSFIGSTPRVVKTVLERDTFYAPESDIFECLLNYTQVNYLLNENELTPEEDWSELVMKLVRFPLMNQKQVDSILKEHHLEDNEILVKAIKRRMRKRTKYRGYCYPDVNLAVGDHFFRVISGEPRSRLELASVKVLNKNAPIDPLYLRQVPRLQKRSYIELELGDVYRINCVQFLAYVEPNEGRKRQRHPDEEQLEEYVMKGFDWNYSYSVAVSPDGTGFETVIDNLSHYSYLWQTLYFSPRMVQKIRIYVNNIKAVYSLALFRILNFKCFFSTKQMTFDPMTQTLIPHFNILSMPKIPKVFPGPIPEEAFCLLEDGTMPQKYATCSAHTIEASNERASLVFNLSQVSLINTIKFLIWDKDSRSYSYDVEVGCDDEALMLVSRNKKRSSWQTIRWEKPMKVRYIKIRGTHVFDGRGDVFRVVHLEAFTM